MMGRYIAIEGPAGVGKTTQLAELSRRLQAAGLSVQIVTDDNRHDVLAERADDVIYLADTSPLSHLVTHYYGLGDITDYASLGTAGGKEPLPDVCIVLDAPVGTLLERGANTDQSPTDSAYLDRLRAGFLWEARQRQLPVVYTTNTPDATAQNIWQLVSDNLAIREHHSSQPEAIKDILKNRQTTVAPHEPPLDATAVAPPTDSLASNTKNHIYALNPNVANGTVATTVATWSQGSGDLRQLLQTHLDQPTTNSTVPAEAQLSAGISLVAEQVSILFTQQLITSDTLHCTPQTGRQYHLKDAQGRFAYFMPKSFDKKTKHHYKAIQDAIFETYQQLLPKLTDHLLADASNTPAEQGLAQAEARRLAGLVLPLSATTNAALFCQASQVDQLVANLQASDLPEARDASKHLHKEAAQVIALGPLTEQLSASTTPLQEFANNLPPNHSLETAPSVKLVDVAPRNQQQLVADILYPYNSLPLAEVRSEVDNWSFNQKQQVLQTYLEQFKAAPESTASVLESVNYTWEVISDFASLLTLTPWGGTNLQPLTPRYGYAVPSVIEDAGLSDAFEHCFDLSLELYSYLQSAGHATEAQYATLLGHRQRYSLHQTAGQALVMLNAVTDSVYQDLIQQMRDKLAEVHPTIIG